MGDVKQMINAQMFYVYEWYIVETGEIFYVGKGSGNRVTSMKDRNEYFKNIRKKHVCDYRIVRYFENEESAYDFELEYCKHLKSIGQARACYVLGNYGRMIEPSVIEKMKPTQYKTKHEPWNKGKKMDDAYKARCRSYKIGTKQSESTKRKRSEKLMNHPVSDDVRKRISEARKKPISVFDTHDNTVKFYDCIQAFASECGVTQSALCRVVKSGKPYRGRYIIKHANPEGV